MGDHLGGQYRAQAVAPVLVWLAKQPIAARLAAAAGAGSGMRSALSQGTRGSAGQAQCHIQTG